ncbi:MAG: penicillin-binding protein 2 [Propionibacteriaceae bacterium]
MATERRPHPSRGSQPPKPVTRAARVPRSKPTAKNPGAAGAASGGRHLRAGFTEKPRSNLRTRKPSAARTGGGAAAVKPPTRIPLAHGPRRLRIVLVAMAVALSLCGGRLLQLQGFDSSAYAAKSADQLTRTLPLLPARGDITDRNGLILATTEAAVAVTADPQLTRSKAAEISAVLTGYLKIDQYKLYTLLTKPNTRFVYLAKKVPALTYSKIAADLTSKKLYGVFRESDPIRTYPGGSVGATLIGYVDADGKGTAGLERSMNAELSGVEGKEVYESAPNGSRIPLGDTHVTPAVNGINYQLTLDSELQWMAERRIAAQVKKVNADSGFAITINVKTGEILAMANAPTYDSSNPGQAKKGELINRAVANPYEPGSVEKVLTSAALLDSKTTTVESRVEVPPRLDSGGRKIKDAFEHGTLHLLMRGVVARSSNIGTILMTRQMRTQQLRDYLASFGLGSRTGIELPSESPGILPKGTMPDYTRDQIAFGQAVSVTGVQEAAAIAGIINGGLYQPPTVIKGATDTAGNAVPVDRRPSRQIVSAQTSAGVRDLMRAVVDSPNGQKNLSLKNYQSGGKTGTAQRADSDCHCYKGYVTSYVGFAPLNDPQILTYVVVNNPRKGDTGTGVAAPVYKDIMNLALPRYSVEPNTKKLKAKPIEYEP